MTSHHLSNYQKQQYTQYLESQLQKFSAFMLTQKKDNEKQKIMEQTIQNMNSSINALTDKIKTLQYYQKQNFKQCQILQHKTERVNDFDYRLNKVESVYFQKTSMLQNKQNNSKAANRCQDNYNNDIQQLSTQINTVSKDINKKIKILQKQVQNLYTLSERTYQTAEIGTYGMKSKQNQPIYTNCSQIHSHHHQSNGVTKNELLASQDKLLSIFNQQFLKVKKIIKKALNDKINSQEKHQNNYLKQKNYMDMKDHTFSAQQTVNRSINNNENSFRGSQNTPYHINQYELNYSQVKNSMFQKGSSISDASRKLKPLHQNQNNQKAKIVKNKKSKTSKLKISSKRNSASKSKSKSKSNSKSMSKSKYSKNSTIQGSKTQNIKSNELDKQRDYKLLSFRQARKSNKNDGVSQKSKSKSVKKHKQQKESISHSHSRSISAKSHKSKERKSKKNSKIYYTKQYLMNCKKDHV